MVAVSQPATLAAFLPTRARSTGDDISLHPARKTTTPRRRDDGARAACGIGSGIAFRGTGEAAGIRDGMLVELAGCVHPS